MIRALNLLAGACLLLLLFLGTTTRPAAAAVEQVEINEIEDFFEPLSEHGAWVNVRAFGWCWYPTEVDEDWRPYLEGQWVQTDEGPYWESDEPWAWACYHYGRWFWETDRGWLWKPDTTWAPAWVDWREGDDVVGWAPLPPRGYYAGSYGVYTTETYIAPSWYVFVGYHSFWRPIYPSYVFYWNSWHHHHHRRYYDCTKRVTKIKHADQVIINGTSQAVEIKHRKKFSSIKAISKTAQPSNATTPARVSQSEQRRVWDRALEVQTQKPSRVKETVATPSPRATTQDSGSSFKSIKRSARETSSSTRLDSRPDRLPPKRSSQVYQGKTQRGSSGKSSLFSQATQRFDSKAEKRWAKETAAALEDRRGRGDANEKNDSGNKR